MDFSISDDGHIATVVSMRDGHASLYTTSGFGVIGGIGHDSTRAASAHFVATAQSHYDSAMPASAHPYPPAEHVCFYLLGYDGVRAINVEISAVEGGGDKLSEMWAAGQDVLTELRLLEERN